MKLELTFCHCLCATDEFRINGITALEDEFGFGYDADPESAEEYGCGNRVWERRECSREILSLYDITEEEYAEIAAKLEEGLSFGCCGWCV